MKTDPVHYYYKDLETGVEMSFSKTDQWGYAVGFHNIDIEETFDYSRDKIPWPELSPEEKAVVDANYENLHKMMNKSDWVDNAVKYMVSLTGEWEIHENLVDYCESLYETYVEEMGDDPFSPKDAVDEDMTYWDVE